MTQIFFWFLFGYDFKIVGEEVGIIALFTNTYHPIPNIIKEYRSPHFCLTYAKESVGIK